jgi:hypothetical protein
LPSTQRPAETGARLLANGLLQSYERQQHQPPCLSRTFTKALCEFDEEFVHLKGAG